MARHRHPRWRALWASALIAALFASSSLAAGDPRVQVGGGTSDARVSARGAPLEVVLRALAEHHGFELWLEGTLDGPVNATLGPQPLEVLLRALIAPHMSVMQHTSGEDGTRRLDALRVYPHVQGQPATPRAERARTGPEATRPDDAELASLTRTLVQDPDPRRRQAAAARLGRLGTPEAVLALSQALTDGEDAVRTATVRALAEVASDEAVLLLGQTLLSDRSLAVRIHALRGLASVRDEQSRAFVETASDGEDPEIRTEAQQLLQRW